MLKFARLGRLGLSVGSLGFPPCKTGWTQYIKKPSRQPDLGSGTYLPPPNVNQSTLSPGSRVSLNTSVAVSTLSRVSPSAVPTQNKKGTTLLECVGRKLRRQFVFASGGSGQRRRIVKQRASPSKVKC